VVIQVTLLSRYMVAAIVLSALGCGDRSPQPTGSTYVLHQASGAQLGMTASELGRARPNVVIDENGVWESVDRFHSNSYIFAREPVWTGLRSSIRAVIINRTVPAADSSKVGQEVQSIVAVWMTVAGPPTDSIQLDSRVLSADWAMTQKLVYWCRPDALLMLIHHSNPHQYIGKHSLVRTIVQAREFRLPSGYGIPYTQIHCGRP
jgi:hypothetical protein